MATIRTAIQLADNFSRPLGGINSAMIATLDYMEQMNQTSGNLIDTSSLANARQELVSMGALLSQIEGDIQDADNEQGQFNQRIRDGTSAMKGLKRMVMGVIGTYLSIQGIKNIMGMADEAANTTARLDIMNDGLQTTAELNEKIMASANRTYSSFSDTADMVSKLGILARDAFANNDEIIAFSELLNKHFVISGTSAEGQQAAMLQLTQAMAAGALRGEELNSVFQQVPTLVQNIADHLGVSTGEIKEMAAKGKITADVVKRAMFSMADETNKRFESMPNVFADIWNKVMNKVNEVFGDFFAKLTNISDSKVFEERLLSIVSALSVVATVAESVVDVMVTGANYIYDNWSWISPIIIGVAVALTVYTIALGIHAAVTWIADGAAKEFFKTLLRNPLFWIALAIGVVVAWIYKWIQSVGGLKIAWMTTTHYIQTAMDALKIAVYIAINWILNMFDKLKLGMKAVGIGIQNIVGNIKSNVLTALENMVNDAIGIINDLISSLNTIKGVGIELIQEVTFGASTAIEEEAKRQAREADYLAYRDEIENQIAKRDAEVDAMIKAAAEDFKVRDAEIKAAQEAAKQKSKAEEKNPLEDAINNALALGGKMDTGNDAAKKTAKNTKKMADGVTLMNDELKYLRDLAEREAINRFTTAEIKVDMTNHNNINEGMDIDGIIDRFGEKVEETIEKIAEEVTVDV